jgi:surfeit locus 1 family protein
VKLSRRALSFAVIAVLFAALAVRLGIWQLHRLEERRTFNAKLASRWASAPIPIDSLPVDTALARYRRVRIAGTWDHAHEVLLVSRTHNGSPGVNFITPLKRAGSDTAILVNRGWVYASEAKAVDRARWRELSDSAVGDAFMDVYPMGLAGDPSGDAKAGTIRRLEPAALRSRFPYPIATMYAVLQPSVRDTTQRRDSTLVRLALPALSEGPHRSYAIQWFFFATVALVGAGAYLVADRRRQESA